MIAHHRSTPEYHLAPQRRSIFSVMKSLPLSRRGRFGFCILLALVCLSLYGRALDFLPRSDQWWYLADTASDRGFRDMAFSHADLTYARVFCKGDEIAFRPIFYFLLGCQKYFWDSCFAAWNATTILFYIVFCLILFRFLWLIRRGWIACAFALLFSVSITNFELATWHHLNPYLVAMSLVLWSFGDILIMTRLRALSSVRLTRVVLALVVASFIWEPSFFLALCMMFYGWRSLQKRRLRHGSLSKKSLLLLVVPVAFWLVSDLAWVRWGRVSSSTSDSFLASERFENHLRQVTHGTNLLESAKVTLGLATQWGRALIFPGDVSFETIPMFRPRLTMHTGNGIEKIGGWGLLVLLIVGLGTRRSRNLKRRIHPLASSLLMAMMGYLFILVATHLHSHGKIYLYRDCSYYALMFNALFCAWVCEYCTFRRLSPPLVQKVRGLILACVWIVTLSHIYVTRNSVDRQYEGETKVRRHLDWVGEFVRARRNDPHFPFMWNPTSPFSLFEAILRILRKFFGILAVRPFIRNFGDLNTRLVI